MNNLAKNWHKIILNIIGAFAGYAASVITIFQFSLLIPVIENKEYQRAIFMLAVILGILMICLVISLFYSSKKMADYQDKIIQYPRTIDELELKAATLVKKINTNLLSSQVYSNSMHNIMHYLRDLLFQLEVTTLDITDVKTPREEKKAKIEKAFYVFDRFLINLLENIVTMNFTYTQDRCSACIKLINKGKIKTLCRDSISFRSRIISDKKPDGSVKYLIAEENTAFKHIIDPHSKETTFCSDNLINFTDEKGDRYNDTTSGWEDLYNACIVAPIGLSVFPSRTHRTLVKGFLWVDNMRGGLNTKENIDYFCGIADILFVLFAKIEYMIYVIGEIGGIEIEHPSFHLYKDWPDCG